MNKEGYQPIKPKKTTKIIPPNTGSNAQMKKDGYTWEDLNKAWWEGFDTCKAKAGEANLKLSDENNLLKAQNEKMKCCENCNNFMHRVDHRCNTKCKNLSEWEIKENE